MTPVRRRPSLLQAGATLSGAHHVVGFAGTNAAPWIAPSQPAGDKLNKVSVMLWAFQASTEHAKWWNDLRTSDVHEKEKKQLKESADLQLQVRFPSNPL